MFIDFSAHQDAMAESPLPTTDVRMRGFTGRTRVETALAWIDAHATPLEAESVSYTAAHGRVLAEPFVSPIDVPGFDRSAMDGFALRGAQTDGAGEYNPLSFQVIGESLPGQPFPGQVIPGTAVRIMTGAPIPQGADAVVPAEYTRYTANTVEVTAAAPPGKNIGRRGEDVTHGMQLLPAGRRLRPQDVGLIASVGLETISVIRRPRVRLLITGNELIRPGQKRGPYQIYEANSSVLNGLVPRDGGVVEQQLDVSDDAAAIREALIAPGADVILVSGGSSVGKEDHAPRVLAAEGQLPIHGMAMRPSSPAGMGLQGKTLVFLLPGNPVSCLCAYDFFAGRAIRLLGGRKADWPYATRKATLARKIVSEIGRVDYCRVTLSGATAEPLAISGASILSSTTRADGFVIVSAECEGYPPGAEVTVFLYD